MSLTTSPALAGDLAAVAGRLRASTVAVLVGDPRTGFGPGSQGSGIVWRADGLVVTNAHVARADRLTLVLPDERRVAARLVARDPRRDLALLQADADGLTPAAVGDPAALRPGAVVLAFGHPLGHANALAVGIVHGTSATLVRHHRQSYGQRTADRAGTAIIRADVRLLPGNSGGPLADASGRVVGVNTMIANGLGLAVSVREVEALVDSYATADRAADRVRYAA